MAMSGAMIVAMLWSARQRWGRWGATVSEEQVSRRQALKRGAFVGGALVWTVPVVQAVSMTAAHAESASAPPPRARQISGGGSSGGGSTVPPGTPGQLSFTGTAVPVTGAAVLGAGLVAAGVTATVAASRSRRLSVVTGLADGPVDSSPASAAEATPPAEAAETMGSAEN
jgi:hypothetical protein